MTYDHDLADGMTAIRENGAASGIGVLATFGYDDLGRRARLDRGNGVSTTYAYDPASRLTEIFHDMVSGGNRRLEFTGYNPAGQIVGRSAFNDAFAYTGHVNLDRAYTVDGLNRIVTAGGTALGYNPLGDLTNDGTRTFGYDFDDRLTGSGAVALSYDPAGRLYREQGAADTRFLYDGLDALSEYDASGTRLRRYVHGPGSDEPLVWYEGPTTADRRWLLADERGSVIAWTTPAGTVGAINSYDDYGIPGAANAGRFQYTGQMLLPEIGVYHYKARAYHPQLGRFLQPDPIGYASGLNLYAYVRNDPVNLIDPLGLAECSGTNCPKVWPIDPYGTTTVGELVVTGTRPYPEKPPLESPHPSVQEWQNQPKGLPGNFRGALQQERAVRDRPAQPRTCADAKYKLDQAGRAMGELRAMQAITGTETAVALTGGAVAIGGSQGLGWAQRSWDKASAFLGQLGKTVGGRALGWASFSMGVSVGLEQLRGNPTERAYAQAQADVSRLCK